ncbi:MAG: universal stress protein [Deltaproteobacteria bacterium]|nr:universal stress protein [Deltaproteobacteria bacterium]
MKLKKILVGLDLDVSPKPVLQTAAFLSRTFGSQVCLLHVIEGITPQRITEEFFESVRAAAELSMKRAAESLDSETAKRTKTVVTYGHPFAAIIKTAREEDADLVCIGARRKQGVADVILGSTAEKIVRKAPCPVLVVKGRKLPRFSSILVPVDFSEPSKQSLDAAVDFARSLGSRITVLHVIEPITIPYAGFAEAYVPPVMPKKELSAARSDLKTFLGSVDFRGLSWQFKIRRGLVTEAIRRFIRSNPTDLIVMGTHGRTGLPHALLGSTTESVLRSVSSSVLTIRPEGFRFVMP